MTSVSVPESLPTELLQHILSFCDRTTLFNIGRYCHYLKQDTDTILISSYCRYITIRLWVCQPGTVAHKPLDFIFQDSITNDKKLVFMPRVKQTLQFKSDKCDMVPRINGCTVRTNTPKEDKHMYSLFYPKPIEIDFAYGSVVYKRPATKVPDAYTCSWRLDYECSEKDDKLMLTPLSLTCDLDLLSPEYLSISSQEMKFSANCSNGKRKPAEIVCKEKYTLNIAQTYPNHATEAT